MTGARVVVVFGMHRSGTSCLAGCLRAGLGQESTVLTGPDNPRGHHEDGEAYALDNLVLAASDTTWHRAPAELRWTDALAARRDALVARWAQAPGFRVLKDPRLPLTWPFWREALAGAAQVATLRHPAAVLDSLLTRGDELSEEESLRLWLASYRILLEPVREGRCPLLEFGADAPPYAAQLAALREAWRRLGQEELTGALALERAVAAVEPAALHHRTASWSGRELPAALRDEAEALYAELRSLRLDAGAAAVDSAPARPPPPAPVADWRPLLRRALTLASEGRLEAARVQFERAAAAAPDPEALRRRALEATLRHAGAAAALAACDVERERAPAEPWWRHQRARLLLSLQRPEQAVAVLDELLAEHPQWLPSHRLRLQALARLGRWTRVLELAGEPPAEDPQPWLAESWRCLALLHEGQLDAAERLSAHLLATATPSFAQSFRLRWADALARTDHAAEAEAAYAAAVAEPSPPLAAFLHYQRVLQQRGARDEARRVAEAACVAYPGEAQPHALAGSLALVEADLERARQLCERALELGPERPEALRLGADLARRSRDRRREEAFTLRWALAAKTNAAVWARVHRHALRRQASALAAATAARLRELGAPPPPSPPAPSPSSPSAAGASAAPDPTPSPQEPTVNPSPSPAASPLEAAESLLTQKCFADAKALVDTALSAELAPEQEARALRLLGACCVQLRLDAEAEAAWRRLLQLEPAQPQALLGLGRVHHKARRYEEARELLEALLVAQPGNVEAVVQLYEALKALDRRLELRPWLTAALERAPKNPRLQLLRGEWLIQADAADEGVALLRGIVAAKPATPSAWLVLTREAEAREAREEALALAAAGAAACPQNFWLWSRFLVMLAAAGRQVELAAALGERPAPALTARDEFLRWAGLMQRLDAAERVRAALAAAEPAELEPLEATAEGAQLRAELARDAGEAVEALRWWRRVESLRPADANLLHQQFNLALLTGDNRLAEALASRLHRLNPRNHGGVAMFQLHETRIFAGAMARVHEAVHGAPGERLLALSRVVLDEPGCVPVALAWLEVFLGQGGKARPAAAAPSGAPGPIPRRLFHVEDAGAPWQQHHEAHQWCDLRAPEQFAAARGRLPAKGARVRLAHPEATRLDLLRLATLAELGGWWVEPRGPCSGTVERLATPRASLVVHLTDRGFLNPALLGCAPGHAALAEALAIALLALDEPPRGNSSALTTGLPALSLGVAIALSRALIEQGALPADVAIVTPHQKHRWLSMPWPK